MFLRQLGKVPGYKIEKIASKAGFGIFYNGNLVAKRFKKHEFCDFLKESKVNWKKIISQILLPDDSIFVLFSDTFFIIEKKCREGKVSFYEELMLCDFQKKQYMKLLAPLNLKVEYVYVLNDCFKKPEYKDVLDYINSVNCHYKFNELPLAWLGLPTKNK